MLSMEEHNASMPRVRNKRTHGLPPGAVYVGRPSKWGNPYRIGRDRDRDTVVARYRAWIMARPELLGQLYELEGKDLVRWCAPDACHPVLLLELANRGGA